MDSSGFFDRIDLLIKSLGLLDPDLLPPSFRDDLLNPLIENQEGLSAMKELDRYLLFTESVLPLFESESAWSDWEFLHREISRFLGTDELIIVKQLASGPLRIFPRTYESSEVDPEWPSILGESQFGQIKVEETTYQYIRFHASEGGWFFRFRRTTSFDQGLSGLTLLSKYGQWLGSLLNYLQRKQKKLPERVYISPTVNESSKILGEAPNFIAVMNASEKASQTDAPIYIQGESGTGKELFAKRVHQLSQRSSQHFVAINCAAVPHDLIESELFGHEKGAFTGAYYRKIGKAEIAHGGTLFLDEVGEMPLAFQSKMLRFLQEKSFTRVGGNSAIESDARIIVATHRDLEKRVREGLFREDLYYRINVIPLAIPPLRKRPGDIRLLATHFFAKYIEKMGRQKKLEDEVLDFFDDYSFPGNVRELENLVHRMVAMSSGKVIKLNDLPVNLIKKDESLGPRYTIHPFEGFDTVVPESREELQIYREKVEHLASSYVRDLERRFLYHVLEQADGKVRKAAEMADINRTLFYKLLKRAGIGVGNINPQV